MQNRGDLICEECGEEDETTACLWRILGNLTEDNDVLLPVHNDTAVLRSPYLSSTLSSAQERPPRLSDTKDHKWGFWSVFWLRRGSSQCQKCWSKLIKVSGLIF